MAQVQDVAQVVVQDEAVTLDVVHSVNTDQVVVVLIKVLTYWSVTLDVVQEVVVSCEVDQDVVVSLLVFQDVV